LCCALRSISPLAADFALLSAFFTLKTLNAAEIRRELSQFMAKKLWVEEI
jgi:hypothetical protein